MCYLKSFFLIEIANLIISHHIWCHMCRFVKCSRNARGIVNGWVLAALMASITTFVSCCSLWKQEQVYDHELVFIQLMHSGLSYHFTSVTYFVIHYFEVKNLNEESHYFNSRGLSKHLG